MKTSQKRAEVQVYDFVRSLPEIVSMTNGNIFVMFAPINTGGKSDLFIVINRGDAEPVDRSLSDSLSILRASIEIVIYGRSYEKASRATEIIQKAMESDFSPSASNGEIGFDPIEISNTVWTPFRLEYLVFENL